MSEINKSGIWKPPSGDFLKQPGLEAIMEANGFYSEDKAKWHDEFARIGYFDIWGTTSHTKEYLFFTRPNLNLFTNQPGSLATLNPDVRRNSQFIAEMAVKNPKLLIAQCANMTALVSPFVPLLSNSVANTMDMPGISSKDEESSSTQYGSRIYYRGHSFESDENHEFSLEFTDTKYLEVYNYFKIADEYNRLKRLGLVKPKADYFVPGNPKAQKRVLYDQIAIFKIIVDADGETILFYAKGTGCFAKGAPRESFSEISGKLVHNVQWKAQFIRDNDPLILSHFNYLVSKRIGGDGITLPSNYKLVPIYNKGAGGVSNAEWASIPFITKVNTSGQKRTNHMYKLKWARPK